jgi:hypothetical protein
VGVVAIVVAVGVVVAVYGDSVPAGAVPVLSPAGVLVLWPKATMARLRPAKLAARATNRTTTVWRDRRIISTLESIQGNASPARRT